MEPHRNDDLVPRKPRPLTLWTTEDVAARLGVSRKWVQAEARAGRLPMVAVGREWRARPEWIEDWIDKRRGLYGA
jgi:excisionase family DNA binding protein